MDKKRCTAILLAAGSGKRMQSGVAKQFMLLKGRPLIWYALDTIERSSVIDDCILVTGEQDIPYVREEIVNRYAFHKVSEIVAGGAERYDSVYNALKSMAVSHCPVATSCPEMDISVKNPYADGLVFIHDGARPFLTEDMLKRCYETVIQSHACVVGMPVKDTIKLADAEGYAASTPDRSSVWQIQTPQVFDTELIMEAYARLMRQKEELAAAGIKITDDAMVVETLLKHPVKLVKGSYENIKITTPEDLCVAEAFLGRG